jgi:cytochrome b involved in lipid metabolism
MKFVAILFMVGWSCFVLAENVITLEDLGKHNVESDCWMAIDGSVYDMSEYMEIHKKECKNTNFVDYCGVDASEAWKKKESGESPHKRKSKRSLEKSKIGQLSP